VVQRLWSPNTVDPQGKPLPAYVRYDDFPDKHPYLKVGIVAATVITVSAAILALWIASNWAG
jgi:hypothetical protein